MRPASFTQLRQRAQAGLATPAYLYQQAQAGTRIRDLARACGVAPDQVRQSIAQHRSAAAWRKQVVKQKWWDQYKTERRAEVQAKIEREARARARRDAAICQLAQAGMNYASIGLRFDLTRERIRQIVREQELKENVQ